MTSTINIPLRKGKISLIFIVSTIFLCLGIFLLFKPRAFENNFVAHPYVVRTIGIIAIGFFGSVLFSVSRKLFSGKGGLQIDEFGISDYHSTTGVGLIKWEDISGIRAETIKTRTLGSDKHKFILVDVKNPEDYINKNRRVLGKTAMKMNHNKYGTPLSISAKSLKVDFNELELSLLEQFDIHKK